ALRRFGDERNLDLAGVVRIRFDRPLGTDVPAEHHTRRWIEGKDASPAALAAIGPPVVDVAADLRLEDGFRDRYPQEIVLGRLEVTEPLGKHGEGPLNRHVDDDLPSDNCGRWLGHDLSSVCCSTTSW